MLNKENIKKQLDENPLFHEMVDIIVKDIQDGKINDISEIINLDKYKDSAIESFQIRQWERLANTNFVEQFSKFIYNKILKGL